MQQTHHVVLACKLLHKLHGYLIVVGGNIGRCVHRRKLVLRRCDLVMLGLGKHAELPELLVELLHKRRDTRLYRSVVMVVKLLTLGRLSAEERAPCIHYILAFCVNALVYEKILLLGTDCCLYRGHVAVSEKPQYTQSLTVERLH